MTTLSDAIRALSAVCNYASTQDGSGFNKFDAELGHKLAELPEDRWSPRQKYAAYRMLSKYRAQLSRMGISYQAIPEPPAAMGLPPEAPRPAAPAPSPSRTIETDGERFLVRFAYDPDLVHAIHGVPSAKWNAKEKMWTIPAERKAIEGLLSFATAQGFMWAADSLARAKAVIEDADRSVKASQAKDASIDVQGLGGTLRPFQRAGVAYILDRWGVDISAKTHYNDGYAKRNISPDSQTTARVQAQSSFGSQTGRTSAGNREPEGERGPSGVARESQPGDHGQDARSGNQGATPCGIGEGPQDPRDELPWGEWTAAHSSPSAGSALFGGAGLPAGIHHPDEGARHEAPTAQPLSSGLRGPSAPAGDRVGRSESSPASETSQRPTKDGSLASPGMARRASAPRLGGVLVADDPGLGKTIEALASLQAAQAFPALIICPASVKLNWCREAVLWLPSRSVTWLNGAGTSAAFRVTPPNRPPVFVRPNQLLGSDVVIVNYDLLVRWLEQLKQVQWAALVADESHYAKSPKAQRTQAVLTLAQQGIHRRLLLTGTPVLNRPEELISQLSILGRLADLGGWKYFTDRYCAAKRGRFGLDLSGASNLQELNERMRALFFLRRTKTEVLTELPEKTWSILPAELTNRPEYERAESDVIRFLMDQAHSDKEFTESITHLPGDQQAKARASHALSAGQRAARAEQLVKIGVLKKLAAQGKLKAAVEWIGDFLDSERKLVVFAHHREIQAKLFESVQAFHPAHLFGEDSATVRESEVRRFQEDPQCRVIVASLQAGGIGVTLTAASDVLTLEQSWGPSTHRQAEDRLHRIGQRNSVTCYYMLAQNTIDEDIRELIEAKRAVVDRATEGEAGEQADSILGELVSRMLKKGGAK